MHTAPGAIPVVALLLAATPQLAAQGLASPGPLSAAHARLDNLARCLDCHDAGRELSGRKCLACHASLATRIRAAKGYHAVATRRGAELACASCHSEHNGRPFRLVKWEGGAKERFDHATTGWQLAGAHARQRCEACHMGRLVTDAAVRADSSVAAARTYLGLATTCASCHLDEHRGRVSRACETCHGVDAWKPAPRFDHDRTRFALTGLHERLRCARCHATRSDQATGPDGKGDATFVDFHGSRTGWATGCIGCHPSPHRSGERVGRCETCHATSGWFVLADSVRRFDHTAVGFPLRGAHADASCESCHLSSTNDPLPSGVALVRANYLRPFSKQKMRFDRCDACHADVHQGQLATRTGGGPPDCVACHTQLRFSPVSYAPAAHDSTRFPLTGAHRATPCAGCHPLLPDAARGSGRVRFSREDLTCNGCHTDPHGGQFASRRVPGAGVVAASETGARVACTPCHITEAWQPAAFDHDSTRYPLHGAHASLACAKCHLPPAPGRPVRFAGLPLTCNGAGCHADPHGGQFANRQRGSTCTACHTEAAWATLVFDHQRDTDYPLDGAHRRVRCVACHKPEGQPPMVRYQPLPHRCEDCHAVAPGGGRTL